MKYCHIHEQHVLCIVQLRSQFSHILIIACYYLVFYVIVTSLLPFIIVLWVSRHNPQDTPNYTQFVVDTQLSKTEKTQQAGCE